MKFKYLQALKFNICNLLIITLCIPLIPSCVKSDATNNLAALSIIHASPGLDPLDIYLNGNRINGDSAIAYTDTIAYKYVTSGSLPVTVKKHISSITYISKNFEIASEKHHSFFITGKPDSVTSLLTQDNLTSPATGKAKLRFLNLSPGSQPLDLKLNSSNTLFTGQAFRSYTDFASIEPGTYQMGIYEQGNTVPVAQQTIEVESGRLYSVWAKGLKGSSNAETNLSLQVISIKP